MGKQLVILYFTPGGKALAERICTLIEERESGKAGEHFAFDTEKRLRIVCHDGRGHRDTTAAFIERAFAKQHALLFISASGIAVRMIAPFVKDKLADSPVLVADEGGRFVIPLLSGHVGGANAWALELAKLLQATPVITTATDIHGLFAVDVFAKDQGLVIRQREGIAATSADLLAGERLTISMQGVETWPRAPKELQVISFPPEEPVDILVAEHSTKERLQLTARRIWLEPRTFVLGMGCRKGKRKEALMTFVRKQCARYDIPLELVGTLSSIDVKEKEEGLIELAETLQVDFLTFTAETLNKVEGEFTASDFVASAVGVDNVCERAAMAACGPMGRLVCEKQAEDGMTLAIGYRPWTLKQ